MPDSALADGSPLEMPDLKDYLTTHETAEALGFHIEHVRRMIREGDLKGQKVGSMWFVSKKSVSEQMRTAGPEQRAKTRTITHPRQMLSDNQWLRNITGR